MAELHCPCCGGWVSPEEWHEVRQWLELAGVEVAIDCTVGTKGAARFLGRKKQTLKNLRANGNGPVFTKDANGRIRYHLDDLKAFRDGYIPDKHVYISSGGKKTTPRYE
jgi:hypothetical protein